MDGGGLRGLVVVGGGLKGVGGGLKGVGGGLKGVGGGLKGVGGGLKGLLRAQMYFFVKNKIYLYKKKSNFNYF